MNGKKAKAIRRAAREELATDGANERGLVAWRVTRGKVTARNDPFSVRGFIRGAKKAYGRAGGGGS